MLFLVAFLAIVVLVLRPVPIPEEKDCLITTGTVVDIYEAGVKDIVFRLKDQGRSFYVNRGLERGLNLRKLRAQLINQKITIKYPKYWTPLDPGNSIRHVSKIEFDGETVFTEID
jgi:hypothetical protein